MGDLDDLGIDPLRGMQASELPSLAYMMTVPLELPMMALRALIPLPQTVKGDLAIGVHLELVVIPPNPVAVPFPVLFAGFVDVSMLEMLAGGARMVMPGAADGGADNVAVCGLPATAASKKCRGLHLLPTGVVMQPFGDAELLMGSTSVSIAGHHAVRLGEVAMSCSFAPVPSPTTRVISVRNVLTGGMSVIDPRAALAFVIGELLEELLGRLGAEYAKQVVDTVVRSARGEADLSDIVTSDPFEALAEYAKDWPSEWPSG